MKALLGFAFKIMSLRFLVIALSLSQVTLWAAELGTAGFGLISTYLSAQAFACLFARGGADNILVRDYRSDTGLEIRFISYFMSMLLASVLAAAIGTALLALVVFRAFPGLGSFTFVALVVCFNVSMVLSRIVLAQKKQALVSFFGNALPLGVSSGLFAASAWLGQIPTETGHLQAIAFLAMGYALSSLVFVWLLRDFLRQCFISSVMSKSLFLSSGREQWYFLGYQAMSSVRGNGTTLVFAAVFGAEMTGVFALANRFGSLLTYLNEPARMFVMPRITGKTKAGIRKLYLRMLGLNAGLGLSGMALLIGIFLFVDLPFSTAPPFPLYTVIIMIGAAVNLFVGPVGAILAMSGNERSNLKAHIVGLSFLTICLGLSAMLGNPLIAVCGVALASASVNLVNTASLIAYLGRKGIVNGE